MSVVDTETGCYKDVHCSTHESPRLFQAWSKGQKPREETVRRTEEVLEIMSPTGLFFFFFTSRDTPCSSLRQYHSLPKTEC